MTILLIVSGTLLEQPASVGQAEMLTPLFPNVVPIFKRQIAFLFGIGFSKMLAYGNLKENHITKLRQRESMCSLNKLTKESKLLLLSR